MIRPGLNRRTIAIAAMLMTTSMIALSLSVTATPEGQAGVPATTPLLAQILGLITDDDSFATADLSILLPPDPPATPPHAPTQHYGPYESKSPDSGTCGNDWAMDTFDRHFTVFSDSSGRYTVVEQFKSGSFVTKAGPSPGACDTSPLTSTVSAGITGTMHGYFIIPLPIGTTQTSTDSSCVSGVPSADDCTTTGFIDSHFTPPCYFGGTGTCPVTTFFFHYTAPDQDLIAHSWKNASPDRGGNSGDIRST